MKHSLFRNNTFWFLGITLAVFALRFHQLDARDLSLDEPFTLFFAQGTAGEIVALSGEGEPNPPLFMLLVHYWLKLVGYSSVSLRIISLVFHALTAAVIFSIGRRFFDVTAGLLCLGLFLASNYFTFFSCELRPYGLFSLLTAGSLYYFLAASSAENKKAFWLLWLCNVLLCYTHYFGWIVVGVQVASSLMYLDNKMFLKRMLLVVLGTSACFLPILPSVIAQFQVSSEGTWVTKPYDGSYRMQLNAFFNSALSYYYLFLFIIPFGLGILFTHWYFQRFNRHYLVLVFWWFLPFTLMYLVSFKIPVFVDRYLLFCAIGLFVFIAALLHLYIKNSWLRGVASALFLGVMLAAYSTNEDYYHRPLAEAVDAVKELSSEKSVVAVFPEYAKLNFSYHYSLPAFMAYDSIGAALQKESVFPVWHYEELSTQKEFETTDTVIFFTNMGADSDKAKLFLEKLDKAMTRVYYKEFSDAVCVAAYKR